MSIFEISTNKDSKVRDTSICPVTLADTFLIKSFLPFRRLPVGKYKVQKDLKIYTKI